MEAVGMFLDEGYQVLGETLSRRSRAAPSRWCRCVLGMGSDGWMDGWMDGWAFLPLSDDWLWLTRR